MEGRTLICKYCQSESVILLLNLGCSAIIALKSFREGSYAE
jgi:hypothetical protein